MAVDIVVETLIQRPREVVAAFAGDPGRAPEWYVNIASIEWETPPPLVVGSRMAFVAHFLGRGAKLKKARRSSSLRRAFTSVVGMAEWLSNFLAGPEGLGHREDAGL